MSHCANPILILSISILSCKVYYNVKCISIHIRIFHSMQCPLCLFGFTSEFLTKMIQLCNSLIIFVPYFPIVKFLLFFSIIIRLFIVKCAFPLNCVIIIVHYCAIVQILLCSCPQSTHCAKCAFQVIFYDLHIRRDNLSTYLFIYLSIYLLNMSCYCFDYNNFSQLDLKNLKCTITVYRLFI